MPYIYTWKIKVVCVLNKITFDSFVSVVCEEPLGMDSGNPLIGDDNIQPSSYDEGLGPDSVRLNSADGAWSPSLDDGNPSIVIELDEPSLVTGVVVKGAGPDAEDFPKLFTVENSPDGINWTPLPAVSY